jgi:hypothetical protein
MMRMQKSTYPLEKFRQVFKTNHVITKQAQKDAFALGFDGEDIERVVCQVLRPEHLYKTMPSSQNPGLWQDVYKVEFEGVSLYVKLQLNEQVRPPCAVVVSFKEDLSAQ